jgi:hypothetical protein
MAVLVPLALFVLIFVVLTAGMRARRNGGLSGGRVLARGLVLSASSIASGERTVGLQRFELRDLVLDVEIPGRDPYEVAVTPLIPRICEGRPGAALDLAVHPKRLNDVVILGPAGSSAWLPAAPWLTGSNIASRTRAVVVALVVAAAPSLFLVGVMRGAQRETHATSTTHTPPHAASQSCDSAARCCKVIGGTSCTQFAGMNEVACQKALEIERSTAAKAHKHCQ